MSDTSQHKKYAAFISYRHLNPDMKIARTLQFLLEYNLVRPNKNVPRFIRPVFLDTSELPAQENLDEAITNALEESECLFVICSPDLPESKYCLSEIDHFKKTHGGGLDRVGSILVRGEPGEAYPKSLRSKSVPDPDDPSRKIEVEVEPLFADVRSKTIFGARWKLLTSEYLRLAAMYYRCSYDALKKRHKRMRRGIIAVLLLLVILIASIFFMKDRQFQESRANSCASHVMEQLRAEDELLALALCTSEDFMATPQYTVALRSALTQYDYKQNAEPASRIFETEYSHSSSSFYYLSDSGNQIIVSDGNMWHIIDSHNGSLIDQLPCESAFVMGKNEPGHYPASYSRLGAHTDEQGVFKDYLQLVDIETNELINEFDLGPSSPSVDYAVQDIVDTDGLLVLTNHGKAVLYFNDEGELLSEKQALDMLRQSEYSTPDIEDPFFLIRSKAVKKYQIKDQQNNVLLTLESTPQNFAFSDDWKYFFYIADGVLQCYDTETWSMQGSVQLGSTLVQSLHPLAESSYCVLGFAEGSGTRSVVYDWRSGSALLEFTGSITPSHTEQAFYTIHGGVVSRFVYNDLDLTQISYMQNHIGDSCLFSCDDLFTLCDTKSEKEIFCLRASAVQTDEGMGHFLISHPDGLLLCDNTGAELWQLQVSPVLTALSHDGKICAYMDEQGNAHVLNGELGTDLYTVQSVELDSLGYIRKLLVSSSGLAVIGIDGSLWFDQLSGNTVSLGRAFDGKLFSDGLLITENNERVNDFQIYDTSKGLFFPVFEDNTGIWCYSPKSGYLVRHIEASGNIPSMSLEIWKLKNNKASFTGKIELEDKLVEDMRLDSSGQYLSCRSNGRSFVWLLDELSLELDAVGDVYYESGVYHDYYRLGSNRYSISKQENETLRTLAEKALSSPIGVRKLSDAERKEFSIT